MHNPALVALGLDWRYLACDVHPERLGEAIAGAQAMKFIGLNLTVPHKLLAVDLVDELDVSAKTWGAVNTVRFEARDLSGAWQPLAKLNPEEVEEMRSVGFNTDADAITRSLREDLGLELSGASVLLLGAGGAGRTAALKLAAEGVGSLWLQNRTASKAEEVAAEIRKRFPRVQVAVGYPAGAVDLLLNATSLGLKASDPSPLEEAKFALRQARHVYDMIYRPAETPLLRAAKAAGCQTANGLGMLLYQGAQALEIWTGKFAPVEVMRAALVKNVYGNA
ncbi:MAG: shikimate dehydrogenase [Proteobacteria bacterium]|nr:shikimate dehydrogenase [Verrucomicrobiota bacterium]NBU08107.1 shikimate dehydrogenase [Pseudomonadota bacterium]